MTPPFTRTELLDLVAEGHAALAAPALERVHSALTVLPKLVNALDHIAQQRSDLRTLRFELTLAVRALREAVWAAQTMHPEVTFDAARVHAAMRRVGELVDKLDDLLHTPPGTPQ